MRVNQEYKVLFCLVEKSGSTNIRIMFLIAANVVPVTSATQPRSKLKALIKVYYSNMTILSKLQLKQGVTVESLQTQYYKMMIVRHPLERLVSAYRDKLVGAVKRNELKNPNDNYSNNLKLEIFKAIHPDRYHQWLHHTNMQHYVTFSDFIQFIVDKPNADLNIHYQPVISLCNVCGVKYDFYGAHKRFNQDAQILATKLGGTAEYISNPFHISNDKTVNVLSTFYSQLSQDLKEQLFRDWYSELEFYYYLYPEERNSHKSILNVDEDIPID